MTIEIELIGSLICAGDAEAAVVRRHLPRHVELTRAEPGCVSFAVEPTDDPLVWSVAERFTDRAAFDLHQERVRGSEWGRATAGIEREYVVEEVVSSPEFSGPARGGRHRASSRGSR